MRKTRDTFLHLLSDNLPGIPIHALRYDKDNPASNLLAVNQVNVQFLGTNLVLGPSTQTVSIGVINDNELTAIDWTNSVWNVLNKAFITPKLDYTVPASPVAVGTNIFWDLNGVKFTQVTNEYYFHFNCLLTLRHLPA